MKVAYVLVACGVLCNIAGCGNSDLESKVYSQRNGTIRCSHCAPRGEFVINIVENNHAIKRIESKRSAYKEIYDVTIYYTCPKAGERSDTFQYSYRNGKLRFVKECEK